MDQDFLKFPEGSGNKNKKKWGTKLLLGCPVLKNNLDRKRKYEYDENVIVMNKFIKFGTNVDLSSPVFHEQIREINKLPPWRKLDHKDNPLSQGNAQLLCK